MAYVRAVKPARILVLLGALAAGVSGCAGARQTLAGEFTPGQLQKGSHIHAFQTASFAYGVMQSHMTSFEARAAKVEVDVPPFVAALDRAGWRADVNVVPHTNKSRDLEFEYYDVDLVLVPKDGKSQERFVLPGAQGTPPEDYAAALAPAAKRIGVPAEVIQRGHFALFGLATMSSALNASDDSLRRHAFGLLVLKEKLKKGERVDYLAPMRPSEESLEDVDLAVRVIADHHRATSRLRAEVIGLTALTRVAANPAAQNALAEQLAESKKTSRAWLDTHHQPQMAEFGVAMTEMKLPTPENMLAVLDKDGYLTAAVEVAKGVVAGDPSATVEGLGKLAPKGSSLRVAAEGTAAALRGDVGKAADCALELAERQEDIAPLAARLRQVEAAVTSARGMALQAKDAAKDPLKKAADVASRPKR